MPIPVIITLIFVGLALLITLPSFQIVKVDEMVVVEISDTGKGIPEEAMPKIFEPFFTTKPANEGTGLGLSLSHMIMDRLSGTIDVESRENQGTTFFIKLQPSHKKINTKEV